MKCGMSTFSEPFSKLFPFSLTLCIQCFDAVLSQKMHITLFLISTTQVMIKLKAPLEKDLRNQI